MKTVILATLLVAALASPIVLPLASAKISVPVIIACTSPGPQGTITTVTYDVPSGTGWHPYPYYYVYGTAYTENVDAYNYCFAGNQVGAVSLDSGGSYSYSSCVTCIDQFITLP